MKGEKKTARMREREREGWKKGELSLQAAGKGIGHWQSESRRETGISPFFCPWASARYWNGVVWVWIICFSRATPPLAPTTLAIPFLLFYIRLCSLARLFSLSLFSLARSPFDIATFRESRFPPIPTFGRFYVKYFPDEHEARLTRNDKDRDTFDTWTYRILPWHWINSEMTT